ncbi:MAG: zinc ribbon domain-containing protein [Gammaproteobacteria bacterium]|nr:zinc ribbon domain-containing protein [Gammaproteobacteria bacterium]
MPIYEYSCNACGHHLEIMQKVSDPLATDCPACGRAELRKLISRAGFQLKGGGWYVTDFRDNKNKPTPAKTPDEATAKSTDGADKKPAATETKATTGDA